MRYHAISVCSFALLISSAMARPSHQQEITSAPLGPFRVDHAQIFDSRGHPFLMRGTQLTGFHLKTIAADNSAGLAYGPHSATSLTAIRLRFNMNTVRLPLDVREAADPSYFTALADVVRRANQLELLVVLSASQPGAALPDAQTVAFWSRCAAAFKDYPNVLFAAFSNPTPSAAVDAHSAAGWESWHNAMAPVVREIRAAGAQQPIVLSAWTDARMFEGLPDAALLRDANLIYEASPRYLTTATDAERDARFGFLASRVPVATTGTDLDLDDPTACAALPANPEAVSAMIQSNLEYLDVRRVSWTMSVFTPGKIIKDLSLHDASSLEDGWTCGQAKYPAPGLGRVIEGYLRATDERSIFVVSAGGGVDLPRGGFANGYGPVMAEHDAQGHGPVLPLKLAGVAVHVTDSAGVTRPAGIWWVSAGWGQVNFVVPEASAPGRARMTLVRDDGSRISTNIIVADTSPGFRTGLSCRGAALGRAIQTFASGRTTITPLAKCDGVDCRALPVPLSAHAATKVAIRASGFRFSPSASSIEVTIGGHRVQVLNYAPGKDPGMDELTLAIPASLRGLGETDLIARVNGRVANVVRINLGS